MSLFKKKEKETSLVSPIVSDLNMVSHYGIVKPNYEQDLSSKRAIDFVYMPDGKVVLLGSMDGQYPYWVSETDIDDVETNTAIVNSILNDDFSSFTQSGGKMYWKLNDHYRRRISVSGDKVTTPFDHGYASEKDQKQYWGKFIAQDIRHHHAHLKELCELRELDGKYLEFLQSYLETLETQTSDDPVKDYENKKVLMDLIRSEDYLLLSDNKEIRDTYVKIRNVISHLYNTYMSIVR